MKETYLPGGPPCRLKRKGQGAAYQNASVETEGKSENSKIKQHTSGLGASNAPHKD